MDSNEIMQECFYFNLQLSDKPVNELQLESEWEASLWSVTR